MSASSARRSGRAQLYLMQLDWRDRLRIRAARCRRLLGRWL